MSRRTGRSRSKEPKEKLVFEQSTENAALTRINKLCETTVRHMVVPDFPVSDLLKWTFHKDTLAIMATAFNVIETDDGKYQRYPVTLDATVLFKCFQQHRLAPPKENSSVVAPLVTHRLAAVIGRVREIQQEFAIVRFVFRWFNRNASLTSIRYYWPTILTLVPHLNVELPTSMKPLRDVAPMLPLIRQSANTMTAALLLPKDETERDAEWELDLGTSESGLQFTQLITRYGIKTRAPMAENTLVSMVENFEF